MKRALYFILIGTLLSCSKPRRTPFLTYEPETYATTKIELYRMDKELALFAYAEKETESNVWAFRSDSVPQGIYQLRIDDELKIPLILDGTSPVSLFYKNGQLDIAGSPTTLTMWQAEQLIKEFGGTISNYAEEFPDSLESNAFVLYKDSVFKEIEIHKEKLVKRVSQMIEHNKSNLLPLVLVQLKAGNHLLFDYSTDANMYFTVDDYLQSYNKTYEPVKAFHQRVDSLRSWIYYTSVTLPGKTLPDISVPNAWGDPIPLSRFRGQNTLYVIWSSDSKESRELTKGFMNWIKPYKNRGLDVCMISMDTNKEKWLETIKKDNLPFWHLSDLNGKNSPILAGLGISNIPIMILVDKAGIILERSSEKASISTALNHLIQK